MNRNLSKELAQEIMKTKGGVRGVSLKTDGEFVLREKGEEGLREVEKNFKELGFPMKYKEINAMEFYPIGLRILSLLLIKETFSLSHEQIEEMGRSATKVSLIVKLFLKYFIFLTIERAIQEIPWIWQTYYTVGSLNVIDYDKKNKNLTLVIEDCNLHSVFCAYMKGFFKTGVEIIMKGSVIKNEETKCFFRGDKRHEFFFQWR